MRFDFNCPWASLLSAIEDLLIRNLAPLIVAKLVQSLRTDQGYFTSVGFDRIWSTFRLIAEGHVSDSRISSPVVDARFEAVFTGRFVLLT